MGFSVCDLSSWPGASRNGSRANEKVTKASEICISLLRPTPPGQWKNPNFEHWVFPVRDWRPARHAFKKKICIDLTD